MKKTDEQLQTDVEEELRWTRSVKASDIGVAVRNGVVTLSGQVPSYAEKITAEQAARRVSGVNAIAMEINVHRADAMDDEDIAETVSKTLKWNIFVPRTVQATVEHGRVTLTGEVDWKFQQDAAEDAIIFLDSVLGVNNNITIKSKTAVKEVKLDIERALERNALTDAQKIKVEANGNKVTLTGTVRSWAERAQAEEVAWAAPGVRDVDNRIIVAV